MAQTVTRYVCQQCGTESLRWEGKCHVCGAWNSLVEVAVLKKERLSGQSKLNSPVAEILQLHQISPDQTLRISTGFLEMDRVLGGGLVPGSAILIGGEPGIGKSTFLLQILLNTGGIYVSAEESAHQVKLRADRVTPNPSDKLTLVSTSNVDRAIAAVEGAIVPPPVLVIDSIQTVSTDDLEGVPGSIGQVRESAHRLVNLAKSLNIPTLIVSHVTKEGTIAGPKVLEHLVDAVIYIEGEEFSMTRLVRGTKNRFGPVHEVGIFELVESGMKEITDPSHLIAKDHNNASGSVVTVSMEGVRPMLIEVQALTTTTSFGLPRRTANGIDYNRLLMLVAVLMKRAKLNLGNQDIYINIAGGFKMRETALDLAVCLSLASSVYDQPLPEGMVVFGEVSLSGQIKPVLGQQKRLEQARKLGYKTAICSDTVTDLDQAIKKIFPKRSKEGK